MVAKSKGSVPQKFRVRIYFINCPDQSNPSEKKQKKNTTTTEVKRLREQFRFLDAHQVPFLPCRKWTVDKKRLVGWKTEPGSSTKEALVGFG